MLEDKDKESLGKEEGRDCIYFTAIYFNSMQLLCSFFDYHPSKLAVPTWKFGVRSEKWNLSAVWLSSYAVKYEKQNAWSASSFRPQSKTDKNHQRLPTGEHSQRLQNGTAARNKTLGLCCAQRYRL